MKSAVGMFISFIALVFTGFLWLGCWAGCCCLQRIGVILEADSQLVTGMNWDYGLPSSAYGM